MESNHPMKEVIWKINQLRSKSSEVGFNHTLRYNNGGFKGASLVSHAVGEDLGTVKLPVP
ncbi:uncharacterized protein G2W53_013409 [Senna tora]|uniref:Uncharacterized protein n=1 Tax=Senna tora TaxID=362788 RepID=A0A834U1T7_9FABA|nr:uncharacterized protein G2W53_013409 [Senna tora]